MAASEATRRVEPTNLRRPALKNSTRCAFTPRRGHKSWSVRCFINDERVKFLVEVTGDDRISRQFVSRLVPSAALGLTFPSRAFG